MAVYDRQQLALNHLRGKGRNPSITIGGSGTTSGRCLGLHQLAGREGTPSTEMRHAELAEVVREALAVLE